MALGSSITESEIKSALGETSNSGIDLCTSPNINVWSKWKPISLNADTLTYTLLKNANFGITILSSNTNVANLLTQVRNNGGLGYIYNAPTGGKTAPYRLGDFRYYNPSAGKPIFSHYQDGDTENIGNVATNYAVTLDGIETVDTGDDTSDTSMTAGIGRNDIYPGGSGLKRGALLTDGSTTVWSVGTIPYGQSQWQVLKGKTVTCLEFLCNLASGQTHVNHTANAADRFYALPDGLHSITLRNQTPAGSKQAYCTGRCELSSDYSAVSYRLAFSSMGEVYAGGVLSNVYIGLYSDYEGRNAIYGPVKLANSISLGAEETSSYYTGFLTNSAQSTGVYVCVIWNGNVQWRTTPMAIVQE